MSLKGDKYENQEEVKFRIQNTIVLYDGRPVYIKEVGQVDREAEDVQAKDVARVWFQELPMKAGAPAVRKFLSSKKFDLAPFPLGYVNSKERGYAAFLSRMAARQNQQGLCDKNLSVRTHEGEDLRGEGLSIIGLAKSQGFLDMFDNKYPNLQEAIDTIKAGLATSVGLSRNFCLCFEEDFEMFYIRSKFTKCGVMMPGDKNIRVPQKFKFHREALEEARIPFN
jgi:hypothetical protein